MIYSFSSGGMINLVKNQTVFPYYHIVNNKKASHIKHLYDYKNVERFTHDIELLLKYYKPLNPKYLFDSRSDLTIPDNHFLLTFDDGLKETFDVIAPILYEKGISAIFFINPDFIDNKVSLYKHDISIIIEALKTNDYEKDRIEQVTRILGVEENISLDSIASTIKKVKHGDREKLDEIARVLNINISDYLNTEKPYLSKSEIQKMIDMGFYFGGHTMSHPRLSELNIEEQKVEVIQSIDWLKTHFQLDYSTFAFPFWDRGASKELMNSIFEYDPNTVIFGNSGIKKDISNRIIQRFSFEDPTKHNKKVIVMENLYKVYNKLVGGYKIKRN